MSQLRLTNDQKLRIIKHKDDHPSLSRTELGNWKKEAFGPPKSMMKEAFGLPKSMTQASISKIIGMRKELEAMSPSELSAKRPRSVQHPALKEAVALWILQCQHRGVALSGDLTCAKAARFAASMDIPDGSIKFAYGWLYKFQQRHKLRAVRIHGESDSADVAGIEAALPELQAAVAKFAPRDVYNMDETGKYS
uniref:HTH CENPB-type domain-containing protein n=1 Tax=Peronospora matthiolae TaxID=2874970 RepID=A0AAV1TQD4_9STRA